MMGVHRNQINNARVGGSNPEVAETTVPLQIAVQLVDVEGFLNVPLCSKPKRGSLAPLITCVVLI